MTLNPTTIRNQFPSLNRPAIFFDNPGGTQIARQSLERINQYLTQHNANHGGAFASSIQSDAVLEEAHAAMADFYNASRPEEIVFGNNMTTLTLHLSRSISRTWNPGDTIVVTRLDHDANVTPWVLAAQDRGVNVRWVDFDVEDGTLKLDDFAAAMQLHPRLVAVGYASNALGTINPVKKLVKLAHAAGAQVYIDNVLQGTSPATVPALSAGSHTLRLERDGYQNMTLPVMVNDGTVTAFSTTLAPVSGGIAIVPVIALTVITLATAGAGIYLYKTQKRQ